MDAFNFCFLLPVWLPVHIYEEVMMKHQEKGIVIWSW